MLKEHWFRELYPDLKVTASFDRSESHTRVIDGQVRCITPEVKPQNLQGGSMMDRNLHVGEPRALHSAAFQSLILILGWANHTVLALSAVSHFMTCDS